ncbi:ribonuclease H-like domain-containing protein [Tanacetum coccineum]
MKEYSIDAYDDDEDCGGVVALISTTMDKHYCCQSYLPHSGIHKKSSIRVQNSRDPTLAVQTRGKMSKRLLQHKGLAIQRNCSSLSYSRLGILMDLPFGKKAIGTKWVFRNKRDERSIVVKNKAMLVAQGYRQEEGIDYDEVKQQPDGIFISQDKLKMVLEVDVLEYRSMFGFPDEFDCNKARHHESTMVDVNLLVERTHIWSCKQGRQLWQNSTTEEEYVSSCSLLLFLTLNPILSMTPMSIQFWQNCHSQTLANVTQQLVASIDSKEYTTTEASVRSKLQLADATRIHNLSDADIYAWIRTFGGYARGYCTCYFYVGRGRYHIGSAEASIQLKELMVLVPSLVTRVTSLEKELKETKQTLGNVVVKLVKKVKSLETALKRKSKKVIIESMKEKSTDFVTPTKASGEAQEEDISPTILEAAKTLSKVASQGVSKVKSTDKGKRYRRRARSVAKIINTGLDAEEEINTGIEDVNTGSAKVDYSTASKKGQREGKAPMVERTSRLLTK